MTYLDGVGIDATIWEPPLRTSIGLRYPDGSSHRPCIIDVAVPPGTVGRFRFAPDIWLRQLGLCLLAADLPLGITTARHAGPWRRRAALCAPPECSVFQRTRRKGSKPSFPGRPVPQTVTVAVLFVGGAACRLLRLRLSGRGQWRKAKRGSTCIVGRHECRAFAYCRLDRLQMIYACWITWLR